MKITAMSDLHGYLPDIPSCDLLLIAGDICPDMCATRQTEWFLDVAEPWLAAAPATHTILTWGNHDFCGQMLIGGSIVSRTSRARILVDAVATVAGLKVWASPWSDQIGAWAFMKEPRDLAPIYEAIPDDVDIIVSHQPPYTFGDRNMMGEHVGSRELLAAILRVRPRLVVCGHIHESAGIYDCNGISIVNASVVDSRYCLVRAPTTIYNIKDRVTS